MVSATLSYTVKCTAFIALLFLSVASVAAEPRCSSTYQQLSSQHSQVISTTQPDSEQYFSSLHNIESRLFDTFEACPDEVLFFVLMAEVQISLENIQLAHLYAKKAMSMDSSLWQVHHILGTTQCMMGDFEPGIESLNQARRMNPDNSKLLFNLCSVYHAAKQYENAVRVCTELLERRDHQLQGPAYILRGEAFLGLNQEKKAKQDFNNAKYFGFGEE